MPVETLRVKLRTTAAGPDGVRQAGEIHDLPVDEAERLIEAGAAIEAGAEDKPEKPAESAHLQTKGSGPFSDDEWERGIELDDWVKARDPDEYQVFMDNWVPISTIPPNPEDERKDELHFASMRRLREILRTDLREGSIALAPPIDSMFGSLRPISPDALNAVIDLITFSPIRPSQVYFGGKWTDVRVYRPDRFAGHAEVAGSPPAETPAGAGEQPPDTQTIPEWWPKTLPKQNMWRSYWATATEIESEPTKWDVLTIARIFAKKKLGVRTLTEDAEKLAGTIRKYLGKMRTKGGPPEK
ncbi:MAG: hypothetical protein QGD90_09005 [Candidatus Hydrogenedentes bacterium]|nr:hypothetical protein [Candidatus Hydrogenedentota bacterium]